MTRDPDYGLHGSGAASLRSIVLRLLGLSTGEPLAAGRVSHPKVLGIAILQLQLDLAERNAPCSCNAARRPQRCLGNAARSVPLVGGVRAPSPKSSSTGVDGTRSATNDEQRPSRAAATRGGSVLHVTQRDQARAEPKQQRSESRMLASCTTTIQHVRRYTEKTTCPTHHLVGNDATSWLRVSFEGNVG